MPKPLSVLSRAALPLIALLSAALAQATDLRIYQSFGEVRQAVPVSGGAVRVSLPVNLYTTIIPDSLDVEGATVAARALVQQPNWLSSLEGQQVTLREDDKTERVTLVRARDLLIRDAAGQYRNVQADQLSYDALPPLNPLSPSWQATFNVTSGTAPTLTYLSRALSWTPRYTLRLSGSTLSLSALADLSNASDQSFDVNATELYAGDVPLVGGQVSPLARAQFDVATAQAAPAGAIAPAPKINSVGELRGLYRYDLSQPFTLPANGTVSLPFAAPKVTFERFGVLSEGFSPDGDKGTLNRGYRLKADAALPGGPVTVREDNRLVGQASIVTTAAGTPIDLNLGTDPDLSYVRSTAVTVQNKGTKTQTTTVKVTYTLENAKDRATRFEITEYGIDSRAQLSGQATRVAGGSVLVKTDVPARVGKTNGRATVSFTVVLPNY